MGGGDGSGLSIAGRVSTPLGALRALSRRVDFVPYGTDSRGTRS